MYQHLPSPVKFREDINGLRAWAVIAVLLFHFSLIGLPGGFAGVDVFFVISGYLMTAIIVGGYEKGNFSIWKFYMARARRILPALLAVIAVLLALGWFWLPTADYQALGAQSAYGMSFLSNIYYWRSARYFDSAAEDKWLLHTWSLAVEAQFYLLYPIFIALIWKFWKSPKAVTIGVLIIFISSLALNLIMSNWKPTAAFYLLPTRGWELAAGALVFLITKQYQLPKKPLSMLFWAGWLMLIGSFFLIDETFVWPGYWAVLPVLGTSLIILAYKENCFLTNNVVAQWLGDRSYSLYLWHWPLVVALYFASLQNDWTWVIGFFVLSIILAHFSYQLIETPTRKYVSQAKLFKEILVIGFFGCVIGLSAVSVKFLNFENRILPAKVEELSSNKDLKMPLVDNGYCFYSYNDNPELSFGENNLNCFVGRLGTSSKRTVIFGDSFAGHYDPFWNIIGEELDLRIQSVSTNWCFPSDNEDFTGPPSSPAYEQCLYNRKWLNSQISNIDLLIISGHYAGIMGQGLFDGLLKLIKKYADSGVKVVIMPSPKIFDTNILNGFIRSKVFNNHFPLVIHSNKDISAMKANETLKTLSLKYKNVLFLDRDFLFNSGSDFTNDGLPYSFDGEHISIYGSKQAALNFQETLGFDNLKSFIND